MNQLVKVLTIITIGFISSSQALAFGFGNISGVSNVVDKASAAQDKVDAAKDTVNDPAKAAEKQAGVYGTINEAKSTAAAAKDDANSISNTTQNTREPASNRK